MGSAKLNTFINFFSTYTQKFISDNCYGKASALSFFTLLAIIPLLAVAFGIAKGFGFDETLEKLILETFYQQKEIAIKVITFARSALDQARGSLIAGVGALALFWSCFGIVASLEQAFNEIWQNGSVRSIGKRIIDFLPLLIFFPFFIVAGSSLTYLVVSKVVELTVETGVYGSVQPMIYLLYHGLLLLLSWIFFSIIFLYIPLCTLPVLPTLISSLIAACCFQAVQWAYINLQVYLTSYNAIYGSFAAAPLFLLWLQASWVIVLGGAEFAFLLANRKNMFQNGSNFITENEALMSLCLLCKDRAERHKPIQSSGEIAKELGLSPFDSNRLLNIAIHNQILLKGESSTGNSGFFLIFCEMSDLHTKIAHAVAKEHLIPIDQLTKNQ